MATVTPRPKRQAVLVLVEPDGYFTAYAEPNIDVMICRVPMAHTREGERLADECVELMLPQRYLDLYRADYQRANGFARPLSADAARAALATQEALQELNKLQERNA